MIKKIKNQIYVLSNYTFNMIGDYLNENLKNKEINNITVYENFDQIDQALLNYKKNSKLKKSDIVIIAYDLNSYLEKKETLFPNEKNIKPLVSRFRNWIEVVTKKMNKKIIFFNFTENKYQYHQITKNKFVKDFGSILNHELDILKKNNNLIIYDLNSISKYYGLKNIYSEENYFLAKIPYTDKIQKIISENLSSIIYSEYFARKKCLILDLDNTLWGGVLGEDGIKGIDLNNNFKGSHFQKFQKFINYLKDNGVILAICSKNNLSNVKEVFKKHDGMILKLNDFSSIKCNWVSKSKNIKEIAKELNIGMDSMVFFDDSKIEREEVRNFCPEVSIVDGVDRNKPELYIKLLSQKTYFHQNFMTEEDKKKLKKYEILGKAANEKQNYKNINEFLKSLKMQATIYKLSDQNFLRFVQMTNKINQFNLTTRRYNEKKLKLFSKNKNNICLIMNLRDKFGDHGLTGLVMCELKIIGKKKIWFIENFLMSCRIISRSAEKTLLIELIKKLDKSKSNLLMGKFIKSNKNDPCKNFYKENGFIYKKSNWILDINNYRLKNNLIDVKKTR